MSRYFATVPLVLVAVCIISSVVGKRLEVQKTVVDPSTPFGHDMLQYFMMGEGVVNLNCGSFGTVCRPAYEAEQSWYGQMEEDANTWFRGGYQPPLVNARQRMSQFVNANESDLVIIENASAGINAVLRSIAVRLPLSRGDRILRTSVAYPMVDDVYQFLEKFYGVEIINVTIEFPLTGPESYLTPVQQALNTYGTSIKLATFDHISSYPASILPVQQLSAACHAAGVAGQIELDVTSLDVEFYVSNAHKWLYSPKGSAMLWAKKSVQDLVMPTVLSSAYDNDFVDAFGYTGTRNYCAFLAITAALDFRASIGGNTAIVNYIHNLAWSSAAQIAQIWNTSVMVPVESMNGALVDIITPSQNGGVVSQVRAALLAQYNTYVQTSVYNNVWYLRISAQV